MSGHLRGELGPQGACLVLGDAAADAGQRHDIRKGGLGPGAAAAGRPGDREPDHTAGGGVLGRAAGGRVLSRAASSS